MLIQTRFRLFNQLYGDLLAVDWDDAAVVSLQLHQAMGRVRLRHAAIAKIPTGCVTDDAITNGAAMTDVIKTLLPKTSHRELSAAIAMQSSKVVIKPIKIEKKLTDVEAEERAWQETRKAFPDIANQLHLDFFQTTEMDAQQHPQFLLTIIAARKEDVLPRTDMLSHAGLHPAVVDVDYYALTRVYSVLASQLPNNIAEKHTALIDFNPRSMVLLVMHQKKMVYCMRQSFLGDALIPIVQSIIETSPSTTAVNVVQAEQQSLVVMSIRRMFQSFYTENAGKTIDRIILTGRCALIPGLTQQLESALGIPVTAGNPLASLKIEVGLDANRLRSLGPAFALSYGLAMRGVAATEINLLPWRSTAAVHYKKVFLNWIMLSGVLGIIFLVVIYPFAFEKVVNIRNTVNALSAQKTLLSKQVAAYATEKKMQQAIETRTLTLQQLQLDRFDAVQLLNEIVRIIPKGIYLTKLTVVDDQVQMMGVANSNLLISALMQAVDASPNLQMISLQKVEKKESDHAVVTQFDLQLTLTLQTLIKKEVSGKEKSTLKNPINTIKTNKDTQNKKMEDSLKK